MKTTIESYQNSNYCTNIQNLNDIELNDLYHVVYKDLGQAIDNDDLNLHDKILPVLRAIKTEIQTRNEVTPTLTEKQTNIQNTQNKETVIKKIFKLHAKNQRSFLLESFNTFLFDRKKISFKTYSNNHYKTNRKIALNNAQIHIYRKETYLLKAS